MLDTVPGIDAPTLLPPAEDLAPVEVADRYAAVLARLATNYLVQDGRPVATPHASATLAPSTGLVATARDLAKMDVGFKQGLLIGPETLATAWTPPAVGGQPGPHGLGWFVQVVNGELVVWQYGVSSVSSSFMMSLPNRRLTMILLANSSGLVEPFVLAPGDVTASPFARVFLGLVSP
jgi:CubicO group peptidase (beta-lactamase class C family)